MSIFSVVDLLSNYRYTPDWSLAMKVSVLRSGVSRFGKTYVNGILYDAEGTSIAFCCFERADDVKTVLENAKMDNKPVIISNCEVMTNKAVDSKRHFNDDQQPLQLKITDNATVTLCEDIEVKDKFDNVLDINDINTDTIGKIKSWKTIDICGTTAPFGGKTVVFAGDFRQVLPVVPHGSRAIIVNQSIQRWSNWNKVVKRSLTICMRSRVTGFNDNSEFNKFIDRIGNGMEPTTKSEDGQEYIRIPDRLLVTTMSQLIEATFPNLLKYDASNRAILCTLNDDVNNVNATILERFPGDIVEYVSSDRLADEENATLFPIEYLNSIEMGSLPPHKLQLKKGVPVMLIRNIDPMLGLMNGTRLICQSFQPHCIEAHILTGKGAGKLVFIPRIIITPTEGNYPFHLRRRQFPLRLAFAMTIHKSQGQTLDFAGLALMSHPFSHGQLYVGLSRVGSEDRVKVYAPVQNSKFALGHGYVKNVVYNEVLKNI